MRINPHFSPVNSYIGKRNYLNKPFRGFLYFNDITKINFLYNSCNGIKFISQQRRSLSPSSSPSQIILVKLAFAFNLNILADRHKNFDTMLSSPFFSLRFKQIPLNM